MRFFSLFRDANYDTANPSYIRKYLRTYGLTPPRAESYETQKTRCLAQLGLKDAPIDKFLYLQNLRKNNVHLFYRMVNDHLRVRLEKKKSHVATYTKQSPPGLFRHLLHMGYMGH